MSKKKSQDGKMIKMETMYIIAFVSLCAGFLGGVIYSNMNTKPSAAQHEAGMEQHDHSSEKEGAHFIDSNNVIEAETKAASNPNDADAWIQLGNLYFDGNQPEKSINAYQKALALNPNNADVLTDMGVMYRTVKKFDKALECFNRAIAINPKHEISRMNKGVVLLHDLNDKPGAIRAWEELVTINPGAKTTEGELLSVYLKKISGHRQ